MTFLAIFGCKRANCDKMDRDRPRLPANRNCYRLLRISWALAQISCFVLLEDPVLITLHNALYNDKPTNKTTQKHFNHKIKQHWYQKQTIDRKCDKIKKNIMNNKPSCWPVARLWHHRHQTVHEWTWLLSLLTEVGRDEPLEQILPSPSHVPTPLCGFHP